MNAALMGHATMENRHGLAVAGMVTFARSSGLLKVEFREANSTLQVSERLDRALQSRIAAASQPETHRRCVLRNPVLNIRVATATAPAKLLSMTRSKIVGSENRPSPSSNNRARERTANELDYH
jgi:hypothetical protein